MDLKRCVVVARSDATRDFLADSLKSMGMDAVLLASPEELRGTLEVVPVCGILLELTSAITASVQDKKAIQEFFELYPSAKFRLVNYQVLIVGETLDGFVCRCRQFEPRLIRKSPRKDSYLAVYLSADETFKDAEKVVTVNVSNGGYFVYSVREWRVGSHVWLRFPGDEAIIRGTVRSFRPWGNNKLLPGAGIEVDASGAGIG
jgi:hypothetical protein